MKILNGRIGRITQHNKTQQIEFVIHIFFYTIYNKYNISFFENTRQHNFFF